MCALGSDDLVALEASITEHVDSGGTWRARAETGAQSAEATRPLARSGDQLPSADVTHPSVACGISPIGRGGHHASDEPDPPDCGSSRRDLFEVSPLPTNVAGGLYAAADSSTAGRGAVDVAPVDLWCHFRSYHPSVSEPSCRWYRRAALAPWRRFSVHRSRFRLDPTPGHGRKDASRCHRKFVVHPQLSGNKCVEHQ